MGTPRIVSFLLSASLAACGGYSAPTTPTSGGQVSNPPPPGSVSVAIQDFSFSPAAVTIKAGTTVHWSNRGPSAHTTTSDGGTWDSGSLAGPSAAGGGAYGGNGSPGGSFDFTFIQAGTYSYHCSLHPPSSYPNFTGTVTVTP